MLLLFSAATGSAQVPLAPAAAFARSPASGGFGLVTAADRSVRSASTQPSLALSATLFRLGTVRVESDLLLGRTANHNTLILFSAGAGFQRSSHAWNFRLGAGTNTGEARGPSVYTGDVTYERNGFRLLVGTHIVPGAPGIWRDTLVATLDTFQVVRVQDREPEPLRVHTDAEIGYRLRRGRFELDGALSQRFGVGADAWSARAGLAYDVLPVLSLGLMAGRASATPWASQPARTFATLFFRIRAQPRPPTPGVHTNAIASFQIRHGEETEIVVRSPHAQRVEIAGDFTNWESRPLQPVAPGEWRGRWQLAPGVYHIGLRVDGGPWLAPPGLPAVPDEFGGESGVFEVKKPGFGAP
jgi:hypothetical protein